jgi:hypothetical protein
LDHRCCAARAAGSMPTRMVASCGRRRVSVAPVSSRKSIATKRLVIPRRWSDTRTIGMGRAKFRPKRPEIKGPNEAMWLRCSGPTRAVCPAPSLRGCQPGGEDRGLWRQLGRRIRPRTYRGIGRDSSRSGHAKRLPPCRLPPTHRGRSRDSEYPSPPCITHSGGPPTYLTALLSRPHVPCHGVTTLSTEVTARSRPIRAAFSHIALRGSHPTPAYRGEPGHRV